MNVALYCIDCIYWNPDTPGYCDHPQESEFQQYLDSCDKAGAKTDASDCPGFEAVEEAM